jgi:non-ribosomal peptide synthetase component E (peptide arylation enzyme)
MAAPRPRKTDDTPDAPDHQALMQAHYATLSAQVAEAQSAPDQTGVTYLDKVVVMLTTVHAFLGALLASLGVELPAPVTEEPAPAPQPEGASHGDDHPADV